MVQIFSETLIVAMNNLNLNYFIRSKLKKMSTQEVEYYQSVTCRSI